MLHSLFLLLLAPAQPALAQEPVELRWAPGPVSLRREIATGHQLFVDSFRRTVDGEEADLEARFSLRSERRLIILDEVRSQASGRPIELRRTYETAEMAGRMSPIGAPEATPVEVTLTSPLVGTSVVWTWVPQEEDYGRYYDAVEGRERLLAPLREDLDLRSLLPEGPVAVGEAWILRPMDLRDVLQPGGRLSLESEEGSPILKRNLASGIGGGLHHVFDGQSAGTVLATLERVEEGRAHVSLRLEKLRFVADLTEHVDENRLEREGDAEPHGGRLVLGFDGEGTLVWDLDAGRAESLELQADETVEMTLRMSVNEKDVVERLQMVGTFLAIHTIGAAQ